jgi:DNA-binding FrmR family transcriptional regulator
MRDEGRDDLDRRLRCVHGHLIAIARMLDRGEDDLKVAHQIQAVQGALTQIQVRLLRAQLDRWMNQPLEPGMLEKALIEIL